MLGLEENIHNFIKMWGLDPPPHHRAG